MNKSIKRELYVVQHGQSAEFRISKYIVLCIFLTRVYAYNGEVGVILAIACALFIGATVHFIFRWKTGGWQNPGGHTKSFDISP